MPPNLHQIQKATWAKELCDQAGSLWRAFPHTLPQMTRGDRAGDDSRSDVNCPKIRIMAPAYHGEARYHQVFQMAQAQLGEA